MLVEKDQHIKLTWLKLPAHRRRLPSVLHAALFNESFEIFRMNYGMNSALRRHRNLESRLIRQTKPFAALDSKECKALLLPVSWPERRNTSTSLCNGRSSLASGQTTDRVQTATVDVAKPSRHIYIILNRPTNSLRADPCATLRGRSPAGGSTMQATYAGRKSIFKCCSTPLVQFAKDCLSSFKKQLKTLMIKRAFSL